MARKIARDFCKKYKWRIKEKGCDNEVKHCLIHNCNKMFNCEGLLEKYKKIMIWKWFVEEIISSISIQQNLLCIFNQIMFAVDWKYLCFTWFRKKCNLVKRKQINDKLEPVGIFQNGLFGGKKIKCEVFTAKDSNQPKAFGFERNNNL